LYVTVQAGFMRCPRNRQHSSRRTCDGLPRTVPTQPGRLPTRSSLDWLALKTSQSEFDAAETVEVLKALTANRGEARIFSVVENQIDEESSTGVATRGVQC
jgi:hypothetical protein